MGKHYVPQKLLRGFEDPGRPGWIWMYDKKLGTRKQLPIKQVAQEPEFYTSAVEDLITEHVEKPANAVIDKIRQGGQFGLADRAHLAYYIGTMIRRVPHARGKAYAMVPEVLADTAREVREFFEAAGREGRLDPDTVAARLAEAYAAELKFQQEPPSEVVEYIETPWPTRTMLAAIFSMTWRFCSTEGPSFFLTSDNPAYFFSGYGLGTRDSELIFPLSKTMAIHCSYQAGNVSKVIPLRQYAVKEFNRRIASGASRFIFYHKDEDWVLKTAMNTVEQCNQIQW